jgi:cytochrome b6-f complex iron-sulfur subunit
VAIAACSQKSADSKSAAGGLRAVGTVSELDQAGSLLNKEGTPVLVVRNPLDPRTITAVNPTCTHKGCTVEWKTAQKSFVCPCHGATYDALGKVTKGPADQPLPSYTVKVDGNQILVNA